MFNKNILLSEIQIYITHNLSSDVSSLILKGSPFGDVSIKELVNQIISKQKAKQKLPTWFNCKGIYYPAKISIEQTSSEIAANYKAKLIEGNTMIDITGGFGVDCYAFSKYFKKVTHCEINPELSEIVTHNYKQLQITNITTVASNGIEFLEESNDKYDCIYIDPSRRNDIKGKVFLLKDCLPNVPKNLEFLFTKTDVILIKNSPMLDIFATINELEFVKEIHVVAINNEVKELLFLLKKGYANAIQLKTINITKKGNQYFDFEYQSSVESLYSSPLTYLYEPNVAILKSGGFHQVSKKLHVKKLHQHSHLYTSNELIEFPGRRFKINHVLSYDKKQLKKILSNQKANIAIRNFPKSVAQIRQETKLKDGGENYVFCTKNKNEKYIVIVCSKVI